MEIRQCTKCLKELPATREFFSLAQGGKLRRDCKECVRKHHKADYQKNRKQILAANRQWRENNPEATKQHANKYRKKNADKCRTAVATWLAKNREQVRARQRAARALKRAAKNKAVE